MSGVSEKQKMRQALELTERTLGSLIASRDRMGLSDHTVLTKLMLDWRSAVRRALGHTVATRECICPYCGIRHGLRPTRGDF
jgi:hypothetical protein